ncbi:MAG TPA: hypothetical protein VEZ70_07210 [Allosphingosinicella sp.]|nr:hypothetical protein [Allosphingosinicella sp.]
MDDRFLEGLRADWRHSDIDPDRMLENLERRQKRLRLLLALERAGGAAALVAALWCGWRAASNGDALFAFAALALLCSAALSLASMRRPLNSVIDQGPLGMLQRMQGNFDDLERAVGRWRWSGWILVACSLAIWLFHHGGQTDLRETGLLSATWAVTGGAVGLWSGRRRRQIRRERAAAMSILAEYSAADA